MKASLSDICLSHNVNKYIFPRNFPTRNTFLSIPFYENFFDPKNFVELFFGKKLFFLSPFLSQRAFLNTFFSTFLRTFYLDAFWRAFLSNFLSVFVHFFKILFDSRIIFFGNTFLSKNTISSIS